MTTHDIQANGGLVLPRYRRDDVDAHPPLL
ncbi:protocatechuate 3,4-dioxygenase subunit beta, partial [Micromonospora inaquosa]